MQLNTESVALEGTILALTEKGVLVATACGTEIWLPKSRMDFDYIKLKRGDKISFEIPTQIALDRGLFDD